MKLYKIVNTVNNFFEIKYDINNIMAWSFESKLPFNVMKCEVMSFSMKQSNCILYDYRMNNINLHRVSTKRDLGVLFDPKFDFSSHVNDLITCSYRNLGFIVKNSRDFQSIATLKSLFNCFVRAKLEYCFLVWNQLYQNSIKAFEIIQRKFTRYCWYKGNFG